MRKRKVWFFASLTVCFVVIGLLVTASSLLLYSLSDTHWIPLGTPITWAGLVALPLSVYWASKEFRTPTTLFSKVLSIALKIILLIAALWAPISYLLSGNFSNSFTNTPSFQGGQDAMQIFWIMSYGIPIGALSVLVLLWLAMLLAWLRGK